MLTKAPFISCTGGFGLTDYRFEARYEFANVLTNFKNTLVLFSLCNVYTKYI